MSMKWSVPILIVVLLSLMASSALSMRLMGDYPLEPRRQIEHCRQRCQDRSQGFRETRECLETCEKRAGFDDEPSKEVDSYTTDTRSRDPQQEFRQCRHRCQTQEEGGRQQRKCEQRCEKQLERQQGYDDEEFGQGRSNIGAPVRNYDDCTEMCGGSPLCALFCE